MNDVTVAVLRRQKRSKRKVESSRNLKVDDALEWEEQDLRDALKDPLIELALQPSVTAGDPALPWGESEPHRRTDHWQEFRDVLTSMHGKVASEEESARNKIIDLDEDVDDSDTQRSSDTDTQAQQNQQSELAEEDVDDDDDDVKPEDDLDIDVDSEVDEGAPDDDDDDSDDDDAPSQDADIEAEEVLPSPPSLSDAPAPAPPPPVKQGPKVLPEGDKETPSTVAQAYASMRASDRAKQQHTLGDKVKAGSEALTAVTEASVPTYTAEMTGNEDKPVTSAVPVKAETGDANAANVAASKAAEAAATGLASAPTQRSTSRGKGQVRSMVRQAVASEEPTKRGAQQAVQAAHQGKQGINTNVTPPPIVLTGNADPEQAVEGGQMAVDEAKEALGKAQQAVIDGPGPEIAQTRTMIEDFDVPAMQVPKMPTFEGEVGGVEEYLGYDLVTPDIEAAFDAEVETRMAASMDEVDKQAAKAQADFDAERDSVLSDAGDKVDAANKKAQADQEAATTEARADIVGKQQQAMDRQAAAVRDMQAEVRKEQGKVTRDIDARIKSDQRKIDTDMAKAKAKADEEVRKGEQQAKAKEAELEDEDDSWWDDVTDFVGDCIEAVTDSIMDVWNAVADAVCALIDAAVEAANALIDAAIEWAKEAVDFFIDMAIGLVDGLLGEAFPELAAELKAGLEYVRDDLHKRLDDLGGWLKEQVAAAAKFVKDGIAAIGAVLEATLDLIGNIVMAAMEGDWAEIGLQILKGVLKLAGIKWEDFQVIVAKGTEIISCLLEDPGAVVGNAIEAVGQGFSQFGDNFMDHFVGGAIEWITGATGITLPETFDVAGVLDVVMQVLGLSVDSVKGKAREHLGDEAVDVMEKIYEYIEALWTGGFAAVWDLLKGDLGSLWDDIIGGITSWITEKVIMRGVQFIASLATGVGAIIEGVIAIYNFVMWLKDNIQKIWEVVTTVIDSVHEFVMGNITPAANKIEGALAGLIPVAIDLVLKMVGLNGLPKKIRKIIEGIRAKVDKALDKMFEKALDFVGVKSKKSSDEGDNTAQQPNETKFDGAIAGPVPFRAGTEDHNLWVEEKGGKPVVMMASDPVLLSVELSKLDKDDDCQDQETQGNIDDAQAKLKQVNAQAAAALKADRHASLDKVSSKAQQKKSAKTDALDKELSAIAAELIPIMESQQGGEAAEKNEREADGIKDHSGWKEQLWSADSPFQGLPWADAIRGAKDASALSTVLKHYAAKGRDLWLASQQDKVTWVGKTLAMYGAKSFLSGWQKLTTAAFDEATDSIDLKLLQKAAGTIAEVFAADTVDPRETKFSELVQGVLERANIDFSSYLDAKNVLPKLTFNMPFGATIDLHRPKKGQKGPIGGAGDISGPDLGFKVFESHGDLSAMGFGALAQGLSPIKLEPKITVGDLKLNVKGSSDQQGNWTMEGKIGGDLLKGSLKAGIGADVTPFMSAAEFGGEASLGLEADTSFQVAYNNANKTGKTKKINFGSTLKASGKIYLEFLKFSFMKWLNKEEPKKVPENDVNKWYASFISGKPLFSFDLLKGETDIVKVTKTFQAVPMDEGVKWTSPGPANWEATPWAAATGAYFKKWLDKGMSALKSGWSTVSSTFTKAWDGMKSLVGIKSKDGNKQSDDALKDPNNKVSAQEQKSIELETKQKNNKSDSEKKHQALIQNAIKQLGDIYRDQTTAERKLQAVQAILPTIKAEIEKQLDDGVKFTWKLKKNDDQRTEDEPGLDLTLSIAPNDTIVSYGFHDVMENAKRIEHNDGARKQNKARRLTSSLPSASSDGQKRKEKILRHPYYKSFKKRFDIVWDALGSHSSEPLSADSVWIELVEQSVKNLQVIQEDSQDFYADPQKGWVQISSDAYAATMENLSGALSPLRELAGAQARSANSFGFWSGTPAKVLAEETMDMTLETSAMGAIFDGIGSITGRMTPARELAGWDHELWGTLSHAYAELVADEVFDGGGKRIEAFVANNNKMNIWHKIEQVALQNKLDDVMGAVSDLSDHVLYHGVAVQPGVTDQPDRSIQQGDHKGTLITTKDWQLAAEEYELFNEGKHPMYSDDD